MGLFEEPNASGMLLGCGCSEGSPDIKSACSGSFMGLVNNPG
jgi:hypothetical protein